jgi:GNAT superfamily N-acetyltransferase
MRKFQIRPAQSDDASSIATIHFDSRHQAMPWLPALHSLKDTTAYFAGHVLPHEEVWVAEIDGAVAGFIALNGVCLDHLYVAPTRQGQGIGDKLLATAKKQRPGGLTLWTFQRNDRARRFYESRGFVSSKLTDGSRNEEHEPDVLYVWPPTL